MAGLGSRFANRSATETQNRTGETQGKRETATAPGTSYRSQSLPDRGGVGAHVIPQPIARAKCRDESVLAREHKSGPSFRRSSIESRKITVTEAITCDARSAPLTVIFLDSTGANRKDGQDWACPDVI